ncbi:PP2C family serine/threonine-protein phosphatase, partial [Nocardia sp. 2YAB30]|uniref:PP2C family protein-serine/threonine phosphatase n=1 Tax=Nocardia sp. 2YAB30 TaxID=3233022 RepID=UPI003F9B46EE
AASYTEDTVQVLAAEFSNGIPEIPLRPHGPNNIPEKLEKIQLFGNPRNWAEQGNKARLRNGLRSLVSYHQLRQNLLVSAEWVRNARAWDAREGYSVDAAPGPSEAQARQSTRTLVAQLQEEEGRVAEFLDVLGAGAPGGVSAQQRHELMRFAAQLERLRRLRVAIRLRRGTAWMPAPEDEMSESDRELNQPIEVLQAREAVLLASVRAIAQELALDPVLRPVAEFDGEWAAGGIELPQVRLAGADTVLAYTDPPSRVEIDLGLVSVVSDIGTDKTKKHNEDAVAAAVVATADGPIRIAVVCDGISSTQDPHLAAAAAAQAAKTVLEQAAEAAARAGRQLTRAEAEQAMREAIDAAQAAVVALTESRYPNSDNPPGTTIAAVMVMPGRNGRAGSFVSGAVGDSRVQILRANGRVDTLTHDHTRLAEVMQVEGKTERQALREGSDRRDQNGRRLNVHALQFSLGRGNDLPWPGAPFGHENYINYGQLASTDTVVVSSDGLWGELLPADWAAALGDGRAVDPTAIGDALLRSAWIAGSPDNISVAVISGAASELPVQVRRTYQRLIAQHHAAWTQLQELAPQFGIEPTQLVTPEQSRPALAALNGRAGLSLLPVLRLEAVTNSFQGLTVQLADVQTWIARLSSRIGEQWSADEANYIAVLNEWIDLQQQLRAADSPQEIYEAKGRAAAASRQLGPAREQRDNTRTTDGLEIPVGLRR